MATRYRTIVNLLFRTTDVFVVGAAWILSYWLRNASPRWGARELPPFKSYAALVPLVILLWAVVFTSVGVYQAGRMRGLKSELWLLLKAHATALVSFIFLAYFIDDYKYSRLVFIYFAGLGAIVLVAFRVTLRALLRVLRSRGFDIRRVIIVGAGPTARTLLQHFEGFPELGMAVVGLVTRDGNAVPWLPERSILGSFDRVQAIVESVQPNDVLVALARDEHTDLNAVLDQLRDTTASVRLIPDVSSHVALGCHVDDFEGLPIIRLNDSPIDTWQAFAKRCLDASLSAIALVVLLPLLVLIGVLVKVTSPGPALYSQERMGLDGRTFRMLKFRSMRVDAEGPSSVGWTRKGDSRRTPLGTLLRRTSLDELPQLWNVLVGHMSLVGPRPERPVFVEQFRREIPGYMLRHKVKAGITGWAQVNGWRGDTSLTERTACDLYYIRNWSLDLDLKILFLTLWKGFANKNAY